VPEGVYFPNLIEIVAVIGMVALGILIHRLLILLFKVSDAA
jgi:Ni/Fe-hydrogenase subunit HybB-like protein